MNLTLKKENNATNYDENTEISNLQPISFTNNEDIIIERVNYDELNKQNNKKTTNKDWINEIIKDYKWNIIMWEEMIVLLKIKHMITTKIL